MMRNGVRSGRWRWSVCAMVAAGVLLAACSGPGSDNSADGPDRAELDLVSLEAEFDAGTLQASPVPDSYVAAVNDDLFVAVALDEPDATGHRAATVYMCDGAGVSVWLSGDVAADQPTRLGGFEHGASIEFVAADDAVHGEVTTNVHGGPHYFEALPATGDAGLYRAEETIDGTDYVGGWIVLDDSSQQGQICIWVCIEVQGDSECWLRCVHLK